MPYCGEIRTGWHRSFPIDCIDASRTRVEVTQKVAFNHRRNPADEFLAVYICDKRDSQGVA